MSQIDLARAADIALDYATKQGMDQAEAALHQGIGVSISARQQELETVEKHNDAQLVISVYKDHKTGSASSADMTEAGIKSTVDAAISIARFTGADDCLGLADAPLMATDTKDLDLHHPWAIDMAEMVDLALSCEAAALSVDERISNSEGASISSYSGNAVYANTHGFLRDGAKRVAILDVDFHHGNGTQDIFYNRDDVMFLSLHGAPADAFPHFLGYADETGNGAGEGYNFNYPMPPGTPYAVWSDALNQACQQIEKYSPDALVISLGVDTFEKDPISFFKLKSDDFTRYGEVLAKLGLPTLFVMEGGYAVEEIGINTVNVLDGFSAACS